jgi:hypothetical protein
MKHHGPHWLAIALVFLLLGWFGNQYFGEQVNEWLAGLNKPHEQEVLEPAPQGAFCAQVITPAVNPETGDIVEYPTPCDVPEGWEVIQNEVPGLDLQVQ